MQLKSIDPNFINAFGEAELVTEENIKAIVKQLGFDADDENALLTFYQEEEARHWLSLLPPVSVFQQSEQYELEVHLPIDFVTDQLVYRVTTEGGLQIDELLTATDFPLLAVNEISDIEFQLYSVTLPIQLDLGYHHLALLEVGNEEPLAVMSLTITPDTCYQSKQIKKGKKVVTTNILGTTTVKNLPEQWAALYHFDVHTLSELKQCIAAQNVLKTINKLIESDVVAVIKTKLTALRYLFDDFNRERKRDVTDAFSTFIIEGGITLKQRVSFDALHYQFLSENKLIDFLSWPVGFQSYSSQDTQDWIAENEQEILFWQYCYWIVDQQFEALDLISRTKETPLKYYKQIVIGATKNSLQMWSDSEAYCQGINIGTPVDHVVNNTDIMNYSPLIPDQLYQSGYQVFIRLLQSNMKHSGVLYIKHIVALLRLWWLPENEKQEQGAFVYYNVYDMLNLIALESVRNKCIVVSDDEDILPDGMSELLLDAGVYSSSLLDFR